MSLSCKLFTCAHLWYHRLLAGARLGGPAARISQPWGRKDTARTAKQDQQIGRTPSLGASPVPHVPHPPAPPVSGSTKSDKSQLEATSLLMGSLPSCSGVRTRWFLQPISPEAELTQPTPVCSRDVAAALGTHAFCLGYFFFPAGRATSLAQRFLYSSLAFDVNSCNRVSKASPFPQKGSERKSFKKEHHRGFSHQVSKFHISYPHAALKLHRDANIHVVCWSFGEAHQKGCRYGINHIPLLSAPRSG